MTTKSISSTLAQNNFGQILDDVTQNQVRYVIERRGAPQAILLSLSDFAHVLGDEKEHQLVGAILRELRREYRLGQVLDPASDQNEF